jgi:succinyl-CoA synthetase alpha subunit
MREYLGLFEADPETDAMIVYGEPGTNNEAEVAHAIREGTITKPVVAIVAGTFQEAYPTGVSFGHVAAMIAGEADTATAKRRILSEAGAHVVSSLDVIPGLLKKLMN